MRAGEHLLEMSKTGHHGDYVILDVAKIKSNVHPRCDFVVCIAALCETSENICLPTQKLHQPHNVFANHANLTQKRVHVVVPGNEDFVLDHIRLMLNACYNWSKRVNNVIAMNTLAYWKSLAFRLTYINA